MTIDPLHIDLRKPLGLILFFFIPSLLFAQQSEQAFLEAYAAKGAQEFFYKSSRASSGGYLYVAGASINDNGNYDMLLTKYSGTTEIWSVNWDGNDGDDYSTGIVIDGSGNIIICGTSEVTSTNYNAVVAKYNTSGILQWSSTYAGTANLADGFASVVVDNSNNVYTCGGTQNTTELLNYLTVKYNSSGTQQWASSYDFNDLYDVAVKLVVSGTTVRTSGGTQINTTDWQMTTVSYNTSNGAQGSVSNTGGDDDGLDKVTDVYTDGTYTYVVGAVRNVSTGYDWKVLKLNSDLVVQWSTTYNGNANLDDEAHSVKVDGSGNVYVTGWATVIGEGRNFVTRKYNSSGTVQWTSSFNEESEDNNDEGLTLELDASGHVLISGSSYKKGNKDYLTVKYKYTDGSEVWRARFNSDFNDDDIPSNIALDESGNIYVIGTVGKGDGTTTYLMCKYSVKALYMPVSSDRKHPNGFIRNRGQIVQTDGTVNTSIKFYQTNGWPSTYIDDGKISYVFSKVDTLEVDTLHRIDMVFTKGNATAKVYPIEELSHYTNFYLGYMPGEKAERTSHYSSLAKLGVYTNTDFIFTNHTQGYRHWIVARSGAPTGDFTLKYTGQNTLSIDANGDLVFSTIFGDVVQPKAKVYTMNNTTGVLTLLAWQPDYVITGNEVSFNYTGTWSGTLVIEMEKEKTVAGGGSFDLGNMEWSTYYGEGEFDWATEVTSESDGDIYTGGITSDAAFPTEIGILTFTCENCEYYNGWFARFNSGCVRQYATVIGGSTIDQITNLKADVSGHLYASGWGMGGDDFPVKPLVGAYYQSEVPGENPSEFCYFARFDSETGFQQYTSFIASGDAFGIDNSNFPIVIGHDNADVYLTGAMGNLVGINQIGNGYHYETGPCFLMRFNTDLQVTWSTTFGHGGRIYAAEAASEGGIIIGGYQHDATQEQFPRFGDAGQWVQEDCNYYIDAFFSVFDIDNELTWSSYFGGNDASEIIQGIASIDGGFLICGRTPCEEDFPLLESSETGAYFDGVCDGYEGFIAKFVDGQLVWSTYYGGNEWDEVKSIYARSNNEFYVTGTTRSTDFGLLEQLDSYYQPLLNNNETITSKWDAFVSGFNGETLLWNTYVGGQDGNDLTEIGNSITLIENSKLIVVGSGRSQNLFPWWDFDGEFVDEAYFDDFLPNKSDADAWIGRFEIENISTFVNELVGFENSNLIVFPNPTTNALHFITSATTKIEIRILDSSGRICYSNSIAQSDALITISTENLCDGVYHLDVKMDGHNFNSTFVKQ